MTNLKVRQRNTTMAAFGGGALILLAAAVFLFSNQANNSADAVSIPTLKVAASMYPAFESPQTSVDVLPPFLVKGDQALDELSFTTVRSLGTTSENVRLWTGLSSDGKICLIALLPGPDQFATMTCVTPERFAVGSLALQSGSKTSAVRAYFLPPGAALPSTATRLSPQLMLGDPRSASTKKASASLAKIGGAALDLPTFDAIDLVSK